MKLFNILVLSLYAVDAARKDNFDNNRNEDLSESDQQKEWKKTCKKSIKNKEESDKFAEKMEKCMQKKAEKHAKRAQKADDRYKHIIWYNFNMSYSIYLSEDMKRIPVF